MAVKPKRSRHPHMGGEGPHHHPPTPAEQFEANTLPRMRAAASVTHLLTGIQPTLPLELADCHAVRELLLQQIPEGSGFSVDVYHNHVSLIVTVRHVPHSGRDVYRRELRAV